MLKNHIKLCIDNNIVVMIIFKCFINGRRFLLNIYIVELKIGVIIINGADKIQ